MLSKVTKAQLDKIKTAVLDDYDESTHTYHIKKYKEDVYNIDGCYIVKLDSSLTTENGNPTLISNWNKGTYPKARFLKIEVSKKLNKMIYVNSIGYDVDKDEDLEYVWSGWLPSDNIAIVKEL